MRLSGKGIGWLIAGALVCCSITETDGVAGAAGTLAIGFVLIAVYLMKQRFDPAGIGWFIGGGIMIAFCIEETLRMLGGFVSGFSILGDDLSTILIGVIVAAGCMYMFYRRNRMELEDAVDDLGNDDGFSFPNQEEVFREETVEVTVEESTSAEEGDTVDFEVTDK